MAEQVSHHPPSKSWWWWWWLLQWQEILIRFTFFYPVSAFYAECYNKRISINGYIWTKSKFLGLSVGVHMIGQAVISVLDHDEDYVVTFPNGYGRLEKLKIVNQLIIYQVWQLLHLHWDETISSAFLHCSFIHWLVCHDTRAFVESQMCDYMIQFEHRN